MIQLDDLLQATGGRLLGGVHARAFADFAFDSRELKAGELFLAVKTDTGDGHDFIQDALSRGAAGILCQRPFDAAGSKATTILVSDTQQAIDDWAHFIMARYHPKVIGVTGSSGKTTTKEAVAAVLAGRYRVFKNYGSYNGRFGLPIALGRLNPKDEIAVLELACDSFGEIDHMVNMVHPQIGIVTTIDHTHLSNLGSLEHIAAEKRRLVENLPERSGWAVLNSDDPLVKAMADHTSARVISYGLAKEADVRAEDLRPGRDGLRFWLHIDGRRLEAFSPLLGRHQLTAVLAAVAAGYIQGVSPEEALETLKILPYLPGRMQPLAAAGGGLLIDDSFNASPEATLAALETLAELGAPGRRIAVLGDMPDLGAETIDWHRRVGAKTIGKADYLITKGEYAQYYAQEAIKEGWPPEKVKITFTHAEALHAAREILLPDSTILVKGGPPARMEKVVEGLLADPTRDQPRLVRQSPGWDKVVLTMPDRPTWVEIGLDAIANNSRRLAELAAPARLMAVLKADAYGHGAIKVARTVLNNGVMMIGVATVGEGLALRSAGIEAPILVLGYTPPWQAAALINENITPTIFDEDVARAFSLAAQRLRRPLNVHVKVDSGMGRLGLSPQEAVSFIRLLHSLPSLSVEGIFTHFATADEADEALTRLQISRFKQVIDELEQQNIRPPLVHAANSAAALHFPEARFDMVRCGIALLGLAPSSECPLPAGFKAALSFKTTIAQVKKLPPDSPVGYGATYHTKGNETIAIIPVGYADGFRRSPRTWGEVLVRGKRAPLIGRVSMDQSAIDVTNIPGVRRGDEVVLIGSQGDDELTAEAVAEKLGTINYEVVSGILARVPRIS